MDYSEANLLKEHIVHGLRQRTSRLVIQDQDDWNQLNNTLLITIGQDWVSLELKASPRAIDLVEHLTEKTPLYKNYAIRVRTENTKKKLFRERKDGWFAVEQIVNHIVKCLAIEEETRQKLLDTQRKIRTVESIIKRLEKQGVPKGVFLIATEDGVTVRVEGVSEQIANKVLNTLRGIMEEKPETKKRGLWDHLQDDDDQTGPEALGDI